MSEKFLNTHLFAFLNHFDQETKPLDLAWNDYLRAHKSIGAHDRRFLGETIYSLIRWKGLLDYLSSSSSWIHRVQTWKNLDFSQLPSNLPLWIQSGGSEWLFQELSRSFGAKKAIELCRILNEPAPLTIRVNQLKTNRDELFNRWKSTYDIQLCSRSLTGIQFRERVALTSIPEFKEGLFEIQDEGSQLIANLVMSKPGEHFLDYCAGSGGKSLAIAPTMLGRGQIYLHDIRPNALQEARRRLRRAGVQNAQFLLPSHPRLAAIKNKMDWVLADVPCSGSGTYRRNPDMKWKGCEKMLEEITFKQREIFANALEFVRPGGHIVYATCSLFARENQDQIQNFLEHFPIELVSKPFVILPESNGPDGFFGAVFKKRNVLT